MKENGKEQGVIIQSLDRAFQILDCFDDHIGEYGVTEIASKVGLGKSTAYGLINTLLQARYLEQNPENKKYRLGLRLFELGSLVQSRMDVRENARPYLEKLSEETGMTVHMAVYQDNDVVYIDKVDAPNARVFYSQVGKKAPMYCTGIGKAILANLKPAEVEYLLNYQERTAFTDKTITKKEDLQKELQKIKNDGYAIDNEEVEPGLRCVAMPIFDYNKNPVAAISVSGTAAVLQDKKVVEILQSLTWISREISEKMGYRKDV